VRETRRGFLAQDVVPVVSDRRFPERILKGENDRSFRTSLTPAPINSDCVTSTVRNLVPMGSLEYAKEGRAFASMREHVAG
jgi:hypothetical protein